MTRTVVTLTYFHARCCRTNGCSGPSSGFIGRCKERRNKLCSGQFASGPVHSATPATTPLPPFSDVQCTAHLGILSNHPTKCWWLAPHSKAIPRANKVWACTYLQAEKEPAKEYKTLLDALRCHQLGVECLGSSSCPTTPPMSASTSKITHLRAGAPQVPSQSVSRQGTASAFHGVMYQP